MDESTLQRLLNGMKDELIKNINTTKDELRKEIQTSKDDLRNKRDVSRTANDLISEFKVPEK